MPNRNTLAALAAAATLAGAFAVWRWNVIPTPPAKSTELEIVITGGFAYVPDPNKTTLTIAYLNNVQLRDDLNNDDNVEDPTEPVVCEIEQIGTELQVIRGVIDDANSSPYEPSRIINLDKTTVTFPQLVEDEVRFKRQNWSPNPLVPPQSPPPNPHVKTNWDDLQYVPSLIDHHSMPIRSDWSTKVNGMLVLKGGSIVGTYPSDPLIERTAFTYKRAGMTTKVAALTDKTVYTVKVPDDKVEIKFEHPTLGSTKLVIFPPAKNKPVRLMLRGLHAHGSAASYADGDEAKDFCAFYSLLEPKDRPLSSQWLHLHYVAPTTYTGWAAYADKPTPGYFCNGDWF